MSTRRPRPTARFLERAGVEGLRLRMLSPAPWRPPTVVRATADALLVVIELAALDETHTEVGLYDDVLLIEGSRRVEVGPWNAMAPRSVSSLGAEAPRTHDGVPIAPGAATEGEIRQGPFRVEVPLPFEVDGRRVDATYEDGLLRIVLPRLPLDDVGLRGCVGPQGRVA